jgi:hypothetical protein
LARLGVFDWGVPTPRQAAADGVRLSLPPGVKKSQTVGYQVKTPVSGDFEITATLGGVRLAKTSAAGATLGLGAFLKDPSGHNSPTLEWILLRDGTARLSPTRHVPWPDGSPRYIDQPQDAPPQVTALRLVRRGGRIYYLYQTEQRGEFRVLDSFDVGVQQVESFVLYLVALDDNAQAEATFRQLSFRAAPAASN